MLILTRRVGETLMIGDEVTVTVLGVKGNHDSFSPYHLPVRWISHCEMELHILLLD